MPVTCSTARGFSPTRRRARWGRAGRGGFAPPAIPALDRRSGRVPALPYPTSRPRQYTSLSDWIAKNVCRNSRLQVINTLVLVRFRWPVLKWPRMAGFHVATEGIERMRWIGRLIAGEIYGSACFEVPSPTGRLRPPNRLYVVFETPFVVWLEPRRDGGWKLRTAYPTSIEEIRKYTRGGRTVWKGKENGPMIKPAHGAKSLVQSD